MAHPISPLAPKTYAELPAIAGVRFATAEAGIKYKNRTDVLLVRLRRGHRGRRRADALEVPVGGGRLVPANGCGGGKARALLVNSGNANAFTGMKGRDVGGASAAYRRRGARLLDGRDLPRLDRA